MFKKLIYSLMTKLSVALVNFAVLLISSRYLGVNTRGEISIFILNISVIQFINEVYTGYGIIHFIPQFNFKKVWFFGLLYSFSFCSLSNAAIVLLQKQLPGYEYLAYLISLLVILNTFHCVLILGKENLRLYNVLSFLQPFILLSGLLFCVFVKKIYTVEAYIFPLLMSFIAAFSISVIPVIKLTFTAQKNNQFEIRPVLVSGFLYQSAGLMLMFSNRYSYYVLQDTASVGLYSSATSLIESLLIFVNGISPVLLSRLANRSGDSENNEVTLLLGKLSVLLTCACVAILIFIPESVLLFFLGNGFVGIKSLMLLYSPAVIMAGFFISLSNYFIASGKQKILLISYGMGFISSLIFAPLLIDKFGVKGAALNANISYAFICLGMSVSFLMAGKLRISRLFFFGEDIVVFKRLLRTLHS